MKSATILFFVCASLFLPGRRFGANFYSEAKPSGTTAKDSINPATTDTLLMGDLNRDKIADTVFVYTPPTIASYDENGALEYEFGCVDNNCFNAIRFSCRLPEIKIDDAVWSQVESAGDLDRDGVCELLVCPGWFTSSMSRIDVYSFKKGKWRVITAIDNRRDDQPLVKHLVKKGQRFLLRGIDVYNDDRPIYKSIQFPK